jgi:hypothetical protein
MAFSIDDFKSGFQGGTRQNRFFVEGVIPFGNGNLSKFHITTTQIPPTSTVATEYNYFGRKVYYPGEKQFSSWSFIVLDDTTTDGNLWKKFQSWQNTINNHQSNNSSIINANTTYKAYDWKIKHLNLNGSEESADILKTFILQGCWPKTIEPISLNMGNVNSLNRFSVVFIYDYIEISNISSTVIPTQPKN